MSIQSEIRGWIITASVLATLAVLCFVVWPYRKIPQSLNTVSQAWAKSAPTHAQISGIIDSTQKTIATIQKAIPTHSEIVTPLHHADTLISTINQTVAVTNNNLNRPCGTGKPCGTLAEIGKDSVKIGDAIVTTQIAEQKIVPTTLSTVASLGNTVDTLNQRLGSPQVSELLSNSAGITQNLDKTTGDFYAVEHKFFFPAPCHGFRCHFLEGIKFLPDAAKALDAADAAKNLFTGTQIYGTVTVKQGK